MRPEQGTQTAQIFQDFMTRFNKIYWSQEEKDHRFKVFVENLKVICELQASELGTAQYGVTLFSDLAESEFEKIFGIPYPDQVPTLNQSGKPLKKHAKSCDWRKLGAITAVKKQGKCKSCWAFAAVSNIEALWNIHYHSPFNLSVQEVVDCVRCGDGCDGGYAWEAFQTVLNDSGLTEQEYYPYVGKPQQCRKDRGKPVAWIHDYEFLPRDEKYVAHVVASRGPVTAILNTKPLQHYQKGIIRRPSQECSPKRLDHVVLIVGYGEVKSRRGSWSGPYWIIQNSWGKTWGEQGYFRLHRGTNACGIAMYPVTAIVENTGTRSPGSCPP
ncbi:cathepsin W isoform X2 [Sphaerodactylus townsendi]|uniref:cathepsin W isoform X2 n=1 Tax=Sphaerodactylus townsendi TaxID=933632 RepID=UPI0020269402|nr:cathepsin W isoform X2 [Sphaerodactylus townsendi]